MGFTHGFKCGTLCLSFDIKNLSVMAKLKCCLLVLLAMYVLPLAAQDSISSPVIYKIDIKKEIGSTTWLYTKYGFAEAESLNAKSILIHMNTYGGQVVFADSIRTKILNSTIPVYVFIDNNAASAGALISIACDSIFMRPGGSIGAATVVGQSGEQMPDKYQSYMRATIRATAEAHGQDTVVVGDDTTLVWFRDPRVAEAMVDASLYVEGISDTGKVLTFTANEAITNNYCEGLADDVKGVIEEHLGYQEYKIVTFKPNAGINIKGFLMNPIFQGVLIMLIIGGLYFELQSPGIGFPLAIAVLAAILYLAPLYVDGLAQNWEIIIAVVGLILVAVEVFVIPGFGVAGISGIILVIVGLSLSMVDNFSFDLQDVDLSNLLKAFATVTVSMLLGLGGSIYLTARLWGKGPFDRLALASEQKIEEGFFGVPAETVLQVGKTGVAQTVLRPSGKVIIDNQIFDAVSIDGFTEKGAEIIVQKYETGQLYVGKKEDE